MNETKSTAVAKRETQPIGKPKALEVMASRLNLDPAKMLSTLKSTVFSKASDEELAALVVVANEYDLNPFLKELYAFPAKGGGICPIVSVDGWNKMLLRQPTFDGIKFSFTDDESGSPYACTATIYVKGRTHPVEVTEYFDECKRNTDPWNNMPRRMLRNRTLCQAARMAFGFSGVFHEEEVPPSTVIVELEPKQPRKLGHSTQEEMNAKVAAEQQEEKSSPRTPQVELATVICEAGYTFTDFQQWAIQTGQIQNADSIADFDSIPSDIATRLLRAKSGLLKGLTNAKGLA